MWKEQSDAAEGIRERYGWQKAAGYLIGEKLIGYLTHGPALSDSEIQAFAARIRGMFPAEHLKRASSKLNAPAVSPTSPTTISTGRWLRQAW